MRSWSFGLQLDLILFLRCDKALEPLQDELFGTWWDQYKKNIEPRIMNSGPFFVFDSIDSDWWRKSKWKGEKNKDGTDGMPQLNSISFEIVINTI